MTTALQTASGKVDNATMLLLVAGGDCSRLAPDQKLAYYNARCEAAGLDPRAQPFEFVKLNGKEVLYARKAATDQLASKHGVKVEIVSQATEEGIRVVTVRATAKDGRQTDEIGAVTVKGLVGDALCNALMKAVTKAKRRAILSLVGLGMLDETEVETIPNAEPLPATGQVEAPRATHPNVAAAAKTLEGEIVPPAEPPKREVPRHVLALFNKCLAAEGKNKKLAQAKFTKGAESVFGDKPKPSSEWTEDDAKRVEAAIWPDDIPF